LTVAQVKRRAGGGARAGTQALTLLATPTNAHVLEVLAEEPMPLIDLRRAVGSPPQTTMRGHLRTLTETGVITGRRRSDFPGYLDYELTGSGRELWAVAEVLRAWLESAPERPVLLGSVASKSAIKALVEGWDTNIIRALVARPLSLTELSELISGISYPSLERRLGAMRLAGQIERMPGRGGGTPYGVTSWLRQALAPLAAAARWERLNVAPHTPPIKRLDVEAAFLLVTPLLRLPSDISGRCRLAVEIEGGNGERLAGIVAEVGEGRIVSCATSLRGEADAWASGSASSWLRAVIDHDTSELEMGGNCHLVRALLDGLPVALAGTWERQ